MQIKKFISIMGIFLFSFILTTSPLIAKSPKTVNLLALNHISFDQELSRGVRAANELRLRDQNEQSDVALLAKKGAPAELVYYFDGSTVSPNQVRLKLSKTNGSNAKAKIEILVSTLSATTGFKSLRVEPIRKTTGWQTFSFEQSAANWVIVKVSAYGKHAAVFIAELQLRGHVGPPVSVYKFNESPASALAVLSKLQKSIDVSITADEASLFADAADGKLDTWTFSEASLLSSGVLDKQKRQRYLRQIDKLYAAARKAVPQRGKVFDRGDKLLKWLHSRAYKKGYRSKQTDVATVLDEKTFNCVSSATLYNILGRRFGMDVRGIEVPDHAFSILYDGTQHADIETTNKNGFNPERNKAGRAAFARETGFVYIPDRHRSKRRELGDVGMVALTYYNHGVEYSNKKQYAKALVNYFKALSLDPKNKSAVKNILAALASWSGALQRAGDYDKALSVLASGLELAPKDYTLRHNYKVAWQRKAKRRVKEGNSKAAIAVLRQAYGETKDKSFVKMQAWIFTRQGEAKIKKNDWDGALKLVDVALSSVDEPAQKEINKWQTGIFLRWSSTAIKKKNFALAVDVLERGISVKGKDYRIKNNVRYAVQEWSRYVDKTQGASARHKLITSLAKRFPQLPSLGSIGRQFSDADANKAAKEGDFERAIALYSAALKARPDDSHLINNQRAMWGEWARRSMKSGDWKTALSIYERARAKHPKDYNFKNNMVYVIQQWSKSLEETKGVVSAEKLLSSMADRFPKRNDITVLRGRAASGEVSKSVKAGEFEKAARKLPGYRDYFPEKHRFYGLVVHVYYRWAQSVRKPGNLQKQREAIAIYEKGLAQHPYIDKMKRRLTGSWHGLAKIYMNKKQWQKAIDVYKQGLEKLPGTGSFKQNIKYCEHQLKK